MNFDDFKRLQLNNHYLENKAKAHQFGIEGTSSLSGKINGEIETALLATDVFGVINISQLNLANNFSIVLGIKPSKIHLGHLNIINEVKFWQSIGGKVFIVIGFYEKLIDLNLDRVETERVTSEVRDQLEKSIGFSTSIVDSIYPDWNNWLQVTEKEITINKVNQLLGWDKNRNLTSYRIVANMVTSFLVPQFYFKKQINTIIPCGITELPFIELTKIVARKLNFCEPISTLKVKIPSVDNSSRMSSTLLNSSIFLSDKVFDIRTKLSQSKTGGRQFKEEQIKRGGDILNCPFFKLSSFFIDEEKCNITISNCKNGKLCSDCKKDTTEYIQTDLTKLINLPIGK